jgi:hypothetical protein
MSYSACQIGPSLSYWFQLFAFYFRHTSRADVLFAGVQPIANYSILDSDEFNQGRQPKCGNRCLWCLLGSFGTIVAAAIGVSWIHSAVLRVYLEVHSRTAHRFLSSVSSSLYSAVDCRRPIDTTVINQVCDKMQLLSSVHPPCARMQRAGAWARTDRLMQCAFLGGSL